MKPLTLLFSMLAAFCSLNAQTNSFPLWPDGAPGALSNEAKDIPTLTVFLPDPAKATGAAMVICPGGGYAHLADHEGSHYARWFNEIEAMSAAVLAGLVALATGSAQTGTKPAPGSIITFDAESKVWVEGTSTVKAYKCVANSIVAELQEREREVHPQHLLRMHQLRVSALRSLARGEELMLALRTLCGAGDKKACIEVRRSERWSFF